MLNNQLISTHALKVDGDGEQRGIRPLMDACMSQSREILMSGTFLGTMDVVAESRRSFKTQRLDILRDRLTQLAPSGAR